MDGLSEFRLQVQRLALGPIGIDPTIKRVFSFEITTQFDPGNLLSLPVDPRYQTRLQGPDGTLVMLYGAGGYGVDSYGGIP